jgi:HK97 gp10 family phage protein
VSLTVELTGLDKLEQHLHGLTEALSGNVLETVLMAAALPIVNAAKANAPYKTGTLRRSIHPEVLESGAHSVTVSIGTDVPYARRIEYGFVQADALGRRYHQPAQPYLRPAYDEHREAAVQEAREVLAALVAKALA